MDVFKENKVADVVKKDKEQHQKKLTTTKYRKGLKLFALDVDKLLVYEVKIETKSTFNYMKSNKTNRKATVNPKHPHVWALNSKNAERKFINIIKAQR